jgi:hypothetical protein
MGLLVVIIILFLLLGGGGLGLGGPLGTILIILAVVWLIGGVGWHGRNNGWFGNGP